MIVQNRTMKKLNMSRKVVQSWAAERREEERKLHRDFQAAGSDAGMYVSVDEASKDDRTYAR